MFKESALEEYGQRDDIIPFFFIRVTTNEGLASIRAWMSVMDLEIWYKLARNGWKKSQKHPKES